jgi:uncharacterized membrane protein YqaE (UPF0057 family)
MPSPNRESLVNRRLAAILYSPKNSLSHKLRRANAQSPQGKPSMNKLLLAIIAILLPPLAAYLQVGATKHLWLNIVLCLFVWVPGVLHALWLVLTDTRA